MASLGERGVRTREHDARVIELIGQTYEAALDPAGWPAVVRALGDTFGGAAALVVSDPNDGIASLSEVAYFDPDYIKSYESHYGQTSPWVPRFLQFPIGTMLYRSLVPELELEQTEYYNDWLKPQRLKDALGGILGKTGSRLSYAVVLRSQNLGDFAAHDKQSFQLILGNMIRALSVHARVARVSALELALFDALDRAGLAAFVVSEDRRLIGHNTIADALLREGAVIQGRHGTLLAPHPTTNSQLERAVMTACRVQLGQTVILPPVGSNSPPFVSLVMPLRASSDRAVYFTPSNRYALILVKDPSRAPQSNEDVLCKLFGLTAAEARLTGALVSGKSLEEISDERNVRYATLRAQLRAVMSKTDTKRQGELIALATRHAALNISL